MKCSCYDGKKIKIYDLTFDEAKIFLDNNPLKPLNKLKNGGN